MTKILVTGGAGYIGSHCTMALLEQNNEVVIFDNLSTGHLETIETLKQYGKLDFVKGDLLNKDDLTSLFKEHKIDAVIHFAAYSLVNESIKNPEKYFTNNVNGTINLLSVMLKYNVKKIIFSSSAAIYGEPKYIPIDENHPQEPINPYGQTKLEVEKILETYDKDYNLTSVRLRYFNVIGADSKARIGEWHDPETHLVPNILKSSFDNEKTFEMYGVDYNTKDGTCVRDYINVEDLAHAHILALKYLNNGGQTNFFNVGTKEGNTVKEIFDTCEEITQQKIPVKLMQRREGDPAKLVADTTKIKEILNWSPQKTLKHSIETAFKWEKLFH